jgi:2-oxo-4-hydroxy-4-carboxy-5-ureidoimidazoline decarboxylase
VTLAEINALPAARAEAEFGRCCGSARWRRMMASARPFSTVADLTAHAGRIWWSLDAADWLEAFAAHPPIGGRATSAWSTEEQAGAASATAATRQALADGNRAYEQRFGYAFLVCATGKSAQEMLAILERRLHNRPDDELRTAAEEQRRITALRLEKLVTK